MITASKRNSTGEMRQRVIVQFSNIASDGIGGGSESWESSASIWANITPVSARQSLFLSAQQTNITHTATFRYSASMDLKQSRFRLSYKGRIFNIQSVINRNEDDYYTEVTLTELT